MFKQLLTVARNGLRTVIRDERAAGFAEYLIVTLVMVAAGYAIFNGVIKPAMSNLGNRAKTAIDAAQ
ncbi:hypothetical protein [Thermaerobacter litoralis]